MRALPKIGRARSDIGAWGVRFGSRYAQRGGEHILLKSRFRDVTIIKNFGASNEQRVTVRGFVQAEKGFFDVKGAVYEGDVVEVSDPRGGTRQLTVSRVKVHDYGSSALQ